MISTLAQAALLDAMHLKTRQGHENLRAVEWYRENACARRNMPFRNGDNDSLLLGVLNAVQSGNSTEGVGPGETGGADSTGTGQGSVVGAEGAAEKASQHKQHPQAEPVPLDSPPPRPAPAPAAASPAAGPHDRAQVGGSQSDSGTGSYPQPGNSTGGDYHTQPIDWKRWAALAALLFGGAAAGTGLGIGFRDADDGDDSDVTVIEQPGGLYPLLDWLEENEYHEPIDRRDRR